MPELVTECPLCKGTHSTLFDQREFRGFKVVNMMCKNCGLVYQSPRMTDLELEDFYQSEYRRIYQGSQDPNERVLNIQKARSVVLVKILREAGIEGIHRYADIGSSSGLLLERIEEEYKCQILGIEPGQAYREYAENRGLKVYETLEAVKDAGEPVFDLISLIHVLEHISEPVSYLKQLREKYLSQQGSILIEVPNLYAHDCFEVAHLISFSRHTLYQVVKKAGYSINLLQLHGQPRSNLIPLYITLLAAPLGEKSNHIPIVPERWINFKRRTGMAHRRVIERLFPKDAWLPEDRA